KLTPEDLHAIAAQLYVEMLKAGFTSVGEFHYLHHQPDGQPYSDRALTSRYLIAAAKETGIGITHLPVLYAYSGFGGQAPIDSQKRFINNETQILDIISALMKDYKNDPQVTIGLAYHSLRAVTPSMLQQAIHPYAPIHIHIAEQMKEVEDCLAWSGKRPVEWLLNNVKVDAHWCLVHATQMTENETRELARSGAVVGLCPTTEANLGDGLFHLRDFIRENGRFGIGSDSHISVSVIEELRWLEYGQRLLHQARGITPSLYALALTGGAQALGRATGAIAVGKRADFIALDPNVPTLLYKQDDAIIDAMVFAGNVNPIRHVIAGGQHVVKDFRHVAEEKIFAEYERIINKIFGA
ncbi:MAG: formimidoylglutamate deiminase, partial [Gammaproteobacteria bacterium]